MSPNSTEDDVQHTLVAVPIVEVTVQEDRALVRREGSITAAPGRSRLRIEGVAPVLVDKSLAAEVVGPGQVQVRRVTATRWQVTEEVQRPAALQELRQKLRLLEAEAKALERRRVAVGSEREAVESMVRSTLDELSEDAGWGRTDPAHAHGTLDALEQRLAALGRRRRELDAEHERLATELADLRQLEAASQTVAARSAAALDLELQNPTDAPQEIRLRVDYLVPGALWRPWHRARLYEDEQGARTELRCEGCVWQATGEDWDDVQLHFSTERPSLGLRPPDLHTDLLAVRKKGPAIEAQTRQQQIHTAGLGGEEGGTESSPELPGIDDGGQAQVLRGRGRSRVPSDGRPYRVPLFDVQGPADVELRCIPELAPAVLLRSEQTNVSTHPLLAGPVDLVRGSGLVGRTSILYVAPGERFELGWGPDNALRVSREVEELDHERKALSSWTRKPRRVRIKLSNLEASPRSLQVRERIAVSELEKVKVELQSANPKAQPDADGFVRWDVRLLGLGRQELVLEWDLVVHDDVHGV
ncbi:mucoidy inhibitor MuiA family protein [Paraliomyxa miuraensis]|uniref:mucoidy inhibitor MuiA family protein n=1 Tax=Paraliomyxa miuraensis TaxID=376150 RepID=UPI00224FDA06|nr:mucoidy inhibitor MuiA family protein [Paraliomyxa miuraensis]MCX4244525.1 mucoidy inhibitor MuiA family protein [Paraliomyxa miuraensis]